MVIKTHDESTQQELYSVMVLETNETNINHIEKH
jgi:hypothetical protein